MLLWCFRVFFETRKRQSPLLVIAWGKLHGKKFTNMVFRIFCVCVLHRWKKVWIDLGMKNIYRFIFFVWNDTNRTALYLQPVLFYFLQLSYEMASANGGFRITFTTIKPINLRTFIRLIISASIIWLCAFNGWHQGTKKNLKYWKKYRFDSTDLNWINLDSDTIVFKFVS